MERKLNGLSDHTFKLPEKTTINKIFVIEVWGGAFCLTLPYVYKHFADAERRVGKGNRLAV